jgi:MoxR-like ATPase
MTVKHKITELLNRLNDGVIEKEEVIALSLLSSVAGESIFLLGAPGVAKSLVARRLKYAYKDGSSFEYLMNRFSTPDEIFGPVSISQLKDHDKYERIVKNYLPSATVVFLDEIWKAGPSIQNALLTVLNEKIYRNGEQEIQVPMKALISASNELPSKGEGLEALWDRFLVRIIVDGVKDKQRFNDMISTPLNSYHDTVIEVLKISDDEYKKWNNLIDEIEIPENVFNVIHVIRSFIDQHNQREENRQNPIYISDRRWRKIIRLLRTSAFLNDRKAVDLMDCFLIKDCLWNDTEQIQPTSQFVTDAIQKYGYSLKFNFKALKDELEEFKTEIRDETKFEKNTKVEVLENSIKEYYEIEGINSYKNMLSQSDYNTLTNSNKRVKLGEWVKWDRRVTYNYSSNFDLRKGSSKFSVFVNDEEFKLKTTTKGEKRKITKKPHKKVEKDWDGRVTNYLEVTNNQKDELEKYRTNDLQYLRINLFVNPELANIVESHLTATRKEIEKFEVEFRKIQNDYKKLKNEEIIIEEKVVGTTIQINELEGVLDDWILEELVNRKITDSKKFHNKSLKWFKENTEIGEDEYEEIKEAIENKLNGK